MGEMTDKLESAANKTVGSVKDGLGKMTNDRDLQAEGKTQKAKGPVQDVTGTVKGKLGNNV